MRCIPMWPELVLARRMPTATQQAFSGRADLRISPLDTGGEGIMRKVVRVVLLGFMLTGLFVGTGRADDFLGEFCWQIAPFSDVVKLNITVEGGTIASLHGVRFSATYSLPFSGSAFAIGNQAIVGGIFSGDLNANHFGGSAALSETATISLVSGNGTGTIVGGDGKFASTPTTWTLAPCPVGPTTHASP
jgi:hypothetical protein